jgi:hypothetical protein
LVVLLGEEVDDASSSCFDGGGLAGSFVAAMVSIESRRRRGEADCSFVQQIRLRCLPWWQAGRVFAVC